MEILIFPQSGFVFIILAPGFPSLMLGPPEGLSLEVSQTRFKHITIYRKMQTLERQSRESKEKTHIGSHELLTD